MVSSTLVNVCSIIIMGQSIQEHKEINLNIIIYQAKIYANKMHIQDSKSLIALKVINTREYETQKSSIIYKVITIA